MHTVMVNLLDMDEVEPSKTEPEFESTRSKNSGETESPNIAYRPSVAALATDRTPLKVSSAR